MSQEDVNKALQVLQEHSIQRGDSFDIGNKYDTQSESDNIPIIELFNNPEQLAQSLSLTKQQVENIKSLITAGGAGLSHKYIARHFGDEFAGAIGGFLGGYVSKRLINKKGDF